ncbi:MAG TPA: VTT domain-containing protein [Acetobacteraceae bacterium]|jgi:membrane protein DedA with SNARE-associated domain|nr:VTT domain-containing protein [Acetobacteraceae bacterium]
MQAEMQHYLAVYGYAALLPLAVVEGPAVTVFAAFLAAEGVFSLVGVYAVVVLGDLLGDMLYYAVGRWMIGRWTRTRPMDGELDRGGRWAARLRRRIDVLAPRIRTRAGAMLLFGKLTHSAGFAVLLAAGTAHVPIRQFLAYNLLGTLAKSLVLVLLGYWFGKLYASLQGDLQIAGMVGFVLVGSALLLLVRRVLAGPDERGA